MKFTTRKAGRVLSALLAAAMVITAMPQSTLTANAAEIPGMDSLSPSTIISTEADPSSDIAAPASGEEAAAPEETLSPDTAETALEDSKPAAPVSDENIPEDTGTDLIPSGESSEEDLTATYCNVTFIMGEHGEDITKQLEVGTLIEQTEDLFPQVEGFCLNGWFKDAEFQEPWDFKLDMVPEGELTLYAMWVNTYTITFDMAGHGENIDWPDFPADNTIDISSDEELLHPTAEGFRFDGWYKDQSYSQLWDFQTDKVSGDTTLYAKWTEIPTYTVTFDLCGHGENIIKNAIPAESKLDKTEDLTPTTTGFQFAGWYKDPEYKEVWDFDNDVITGNTTLYAKWDEDKIKYTVSFDFLGHGTEIKREIREGDLIEQTEDLLPTEEGYHFENWYKDSEFTDVWDFNKDTVEKDITLYAKWIQLAEGEFVVTFNLSEHGINFYQYLIKDSKLDESAIRPEDEPEYRFAGWYKSDAFTEADKWNFEQDTIQGDITLYAKWDEILYTVTFDLSGKGNNIQKTGIKPGNLIPKTEDLQPTANGFIFDDWYKDSEFTQVWDFGTDTVTGDITLYAKWTPCYTVTFDLQGKGTNIVKSGIREGSLLEQTAELQPKAEGYHFENWYKEYDAETGKYTGIWDFDNDTVMSDITLYAKWQSLEGIDYIITFDLMGYGANFYQYVSKSAEGKITKPEDPTADGYMFLNWCTDTSLRSYWDFEEDKATANMTLYAKWKDITSLRIEAIQAQPYTGKAIKPALSVYAESTESSDDLSEQTNVLLKSGKDYSVKYFNNINTSALLLEQSIDAGTCAENDTLEGGYNTTGEKVVGGFNPALPYVLVEAKGNYEGKVYMNFVISQISIGDENNNTAPGITLNCNDQLPIGTPKKDQKTIASLKYKAALKENIDYTASITLDGSEIQGSIIPKDASIWGEAGGDCTLTITGMGNYTGTIVRPIIVRAKDTMLKNAKISLGAKCKSKPLSSAGEDGVTLIPAYSETFDEEVYDKNDEPVYDKNGEIKTKKVTVYYQYIDGEWKTDQDMWDYDYDDEGNEIVHKRKLDRSNAFTVKIGSEWLVYGKHFDIQYVNNTSVGTATMTIVGKGKYIGSKSVTFKITGMKFNASTVTFAKDDEGGGGWISKFAYDGTEKTQSVTLESKKRTKVYDCGYENGDEEEYEDKNGDLQTRKHKHNKNCDSHVDIDHVFTPDEYTVTYVNNVKVGTATAIFTANPATGYSGSFKKTFKIIGVNMAEFVTFNGPETLEPTITEYEVNTGKKDEDGEPIYITKQKVNSTRYMEGSVPYVKSGATLNFYLTSGISEEPLVLNKDYTISYKNNKSVTPWKTTKWRDRWEEEDDNGKVHWVYGDWEYEDNPVDAKMGALVITGKGNYSGKVTIKYVITQGTMNDESAIVEVARSEYNPNTKEYKPKVTVWTENAGYLSAKEFSVKYENNKKADVAEYLENGGPAPTATVTFKKNGNYTNLSDTKDDDGNVEEKYNDNPITLAPVTLQFFNNKLTAKNLYIIIDNENPKELVYTGKQVTNVDVRVYYGDPAAINAVKKAKVTNDGLLTEPLSDGGQYGLTRLEEADADNNGDYIVTYGKNNTIGKNKGSITITGLGEYGGSVSQKFTIFKKPVSYRVTEPVIE